MSILYGGSGDVREGLGNPTELEYSASLINKSRTSATDIVNGYLEVVYPDNIPFTSTGDVPSLVNTLTNDLSVYFCRRDAHRGIAPLVDSVKEEYYQRPIDILEKIKTGDMTIPELGSLQGGNISTPAADATGKPYTPIFGEGDETTWQLDSKRLDAEAEERE